MLYTDIITRLIHEASRIRVSLLIVILIILYPSDISNDFKADQFHIATDTELKGNN